MNKSSFALKRDKVMREIFGTDLTSPNQTGLTSDRFGYMKRYSIVRLSALNFCSEHQYNWNLSLRWNKPTFQLRPWYQSKLGWTTFPYSSSIGSFIFLVIFRVSINHSFWLYYLPLDIFVVGICGTAHFGNVNCYWIDRW